MSFSGAGSWCFVATVAAVLIVGPYSRARAQAGCRREGQTVAAVAGRELRVASGGAALVGIGPWAGGTLQFVPRAGGATEGVAALPRALRWQHGRSRVAVRGEAIAPGLFRVPLPTGATPGDYVLAGTGGAVTVHVTADALPPPPAPPAIRSIQLRSGPPPAPGSEGRSETYLIAELDAPAPAGVVAAVVYRQRDGVSVPIQWVPLGTAPRLFLRTASSPCEVLTAGTVFPAVGDTLAIAWVDAAGQISGPSAPLGVTAGPVWSP